MDFTFILLNREEFLNLTFLRKIIVICKDMKWFVWVCALELIITIKITIMAITTIKQLMILIPFCVLGTVLWILHWLSHLIFIVIPWRKLLLSLFYNWWHRYEDVKEFSQCHTTSKWGSQDPAWIQPWIRDLSGHIPFWMWLEFIVNLKIIMNACIFRSQI